MKKLHLYHGSENTIIKPEWNKGKIHNDYGRGFYCTDRKELAGEWACKNNTDGYINSYEIEPEGLRILNINSNEYNILNWIAILLKHREFSLESEIEILGMQFLLKYYYIDVSKYDIIIGYRADDSYFSYAERFLANTISVSMLGQAMQLGKLGTQTVIKSKKAFELLKYTGTVSASRNTYYAKYLNRDTKARDDFRKMAAKSGDIKNQRFLSDIIREENI